MKKLLGIIPIYIGILLADYILTFHFKLYYIEFMVPLEFMYVMINIIHITQVTLIVLGIYFLLRKNKNTWFSFPLCNFFIGFLFTIIYFTLSIFVVPRLGILNSWYFDFLFLPIIIFLPLCYLINKLHNLTI